MECMKCVCFGSGWCGRCRWGVGRGLWLDPGRMGWCYVCVSCESGLLCRWQVQVYNSFFARSFVYATPTLWNALDLDIRLLPFDTLKKKFKTHLYLKYFVN